MEHRWTISSYHDNDVGLLLVQIKKIHGIIDVADTFAFKPGMINHFEVKLYLETILFIIEETG